MTKTEEFIEKARKVHGDKYDYSKVEYVRAIEKVCITCPVHGEFWQTPSSHLSGNGCRECGRISMSQKHSKNNDWFIEKAKEIHGNKYDYSKVEYVNNSTKVCITCPEHGEFWQTPSNHLKGNGCPKCHIRSRMDTNTFIRKAQFVHGYKYDYSKTFCDGVKKYVEITCPKHGVFRQKANRHLKGHGCPTCNFGFTRTLKLSLLQSEDLVHLSSHQLIEIIGDKKLPSEFKSLIYSPANSDARKSTIQQLKNLFDNNANDEDIENGALDLAREKENDVASLETDTYNDNSSLSSTISEIHIHDNLVYSTPNDESAKFLVLEETHKLWNNVLDMSEENKLEEALEIIRNEEGGEFWKYIQTTFLDEFNEVNSIKPSKDYKFPYEPSLMQKLMVYHLMHNKSYGNWCGTGAGKTNAFLFATRKTNSRVTVAIVPNDTIGTLVKATNRIYPDSNIIIPQSCDDLYTCDRNRFNYIIYNYEKFQGNNGADETINKLLETNTIDFICLDEVQNVKVRNAKNASSRSKFVNSLVTRGRVANPEMRTLVMSATPCINNLTEVRSIIELLTGEIHKEIGNENTITNIHNAYKALLLNGFRYVPKYPIDIEERFVEIDCSNDSELHRDLLNKKQGDISGVEYLLAERKLDVIKRELKHGTIVFSTWVDGMAELLTEHIRKWGFTVETYNGQSGSINERKDIVDKFIDGEIDVLVCSNTISTGIDGLQYKCNKMIIVSLPWTDADYAQLKGRIYRQGSHFKRVEFVIPQVVLNAKGVDMWSWDKMRKQAIDTKKSLGNAIVEGHIQKTYTINHEKLLSEALEMFRIRNIG